MTQVFNDNVQIDLTIGGLEFYLKQATVELSRISTPNYVDMVIVPTSLTANILETQEEFAETVVASDITTPPESLIGTSFRLEADTDLISNRDTEAEEDTLLFDGVLANISSTGEKTYEAIAYDPSQQPFAPDNDGGSMMNQTIDLGLPEYEYEREQFDTTTGTEYKTQTILASELIQRCTDELGLDDENVDIELERGGITVEGEEGSYTGAYEGNLFFAESKITVKEALDKARDWTKSEWWFDKEGVFHFGLPDPTRHELQFIIDADAGKVTPPYQSVRVIGSGAASQEGFSRATMDIEDKIVEEAEIAIDENGDPIADFNIDAEPKQPVFEYINLELSNDEQADNAVRKIIEKLSEQQSDGVVTVVGFPEIVPFDGIIMPQASDPDKTNYNPRQPMGGSGYNVYKVVHELNPSDGFITKIHVAGVTGVTRTQIKSTLAFDEVDIDDVPEIPGGVPADTPPPP